MKTIKKILVLGSGALKIGEAGEFDYSGSQAIKAFKEMGLKIILVNPNIATYQTTEFLANEIYFLPITPEYVEKIIQKEKPDAITISFGGQTSLNCGIELYKRGILKKYRVQILGTPIESVIISEDRQIFADHLKKIGVSVPESKAAYSYKEAEKNASKLGYPVMIRAGYALGGQKSGVAFNQKQLKEIVEIALSFSSQVLIEKYLHHFKEIEYEIVRDKDDNCVAVCNMENMDPLGIHTGESIVVAPSQTLTNHEYHYLRKIAIKIVKSLHVIGECNVQFALNPNKMEYFVIEMNARLSRSSALASKATGYPLAYIAALLAIGKNLMEIKNQVTKVTQSFFEPALDYLVVKIPRWDLEKFDSVEEKIGSSMKSVGEVMAIGRSFEEAIQKAVRMLDIGLTGLTDTDHVQHFYNIDYINTPTPKRIFAIVQGFCKGLTVDYIYAQTGIDPWFLYRIKNIVDREKNFISRKKIDKEQLTILKQLGFSDKRIGEIIGFTELYIRDLRKKLKIFPSVFQIDTLAGEVPAKTNYLYMTYCGNHHDVKPLGKKSVVVLGSGTYRIGSSVEFDWSSVNAAIALNKNKRKSILINCNPETVSTDYDISDRLYFEELSFERVADIYEFEHPDGVIISVGGQTPNNLSSKLSNHKIKILGTSAIDIDTAEDRSKFSHLLDTLGIPQPWWSKFTTIDAALEFTKKIGYPVLIRPSYVLSGKAMSVCYSEDELKKYIQKAALVNKKYPLTVSKFFTNAKEIELDGVAQKGKIIAFAISEHIENAGVHSGDATIVYPPQRMYILTEKKIKEIANKLVKALHVTGPFNIQFLARDNEVFVIEINIRASRTLPFISKATCVNFVSLFVDALYKKIKPISIPYPDYVLVKAPQFSFSRLEGADPILRVEMSSTGEVACLGDSFEEAYLKALYATGIKIHTKSALLSIGGIMNKKKFLDSAIHLQKLGFELFATEKTREYLEDNKVYTKKVYKEYEKKSPTVTELIHTKKISLVINLSDMSEGEGRSFTKQLSDGYVIRRAAIDNNISLFTDLNKAIFFIYALSRYKFTQLQIKSWNEYRR